MNTNTDTINKLKNDGFKVNIVHNRFSKSLQAYLPTAYFRATETQDDICPHKGLTIATLRKDGKVYTAISKCHDNDSFKYKLGTQLALGRAIEQSNNVYLA